VALGQQTNSKSSITEAQELDFEEEVEEIVKKVPNALKLDAVGTSGFYWEQTQPSLLVLSSSQPISSYKVVGFDMDDTLIRPKSGQKFPKNRNDWTWFAGNSLRSDSYRLFSEVPEKLQQLHNDGYKIVIFTNQLGISKGKQSAEDIKGKIQDLASEVIQLLISLIHKA
jgi:HAD superfamily hydrolase (TIGR01662 family)